ncbi:hypothetical protein BCL57_002453 [Agromyces flavus]|uniref:Uncharacterized protein n=1 Tax=Agromyces flavus TaxID=589382 RepID=A0A1H1U6R6_9MICO|nr:hypothetical protein [Agromyces flavus]MCP2368280.1 hypothetical protein [Agromyces flavus]GGI47741.1 hypothetical protein GCM10010932_24290 [Agromyces flavus]SDS68043.1 hypothetical protein SAMN04489721_1722 [Agromyces flavus]
MNLLRRTARDDEAPRDTTHESQFRRPTRSARAAEDIRGAHGGRRLAAGVALAAGAIVLAHLVHAISLTSTFPPDTSALPGWIALAVVTLGGVVATRGISQVSDTVLVALLIGLAVPVWLDVAATSSLLPLGITPTAAPAAAAVLMPVAALRETRTPVAAASVIAAVLAVVALIQAPEAGTTTVVGLGVAASAVVPVVLVTVAVRGFRRLVGRELDLSLVQSTVATPRSAVGMRASEELAELDYDAESLLDDVGSGRIAIPLPGDAADRAGRLAARLRVRLIEGRTDTWLRHAVTESAYLSRRVSVDDPGGLAGLLAPPQRDGLLLALWLIAGQRRRKASEPPLEVRVVCRDAEAEPQHDADPLGDASRVAIRFEVSGVTARKVDAATWEALASVGGHDVVQGPDGFRVDVDCRIEPTVRGGTSAPRSAAYPRGV